MSLNSILPPLFHQQNLKDFVLWGEDVKLLQCLILSLSVVQFTRGISLYFLSLVPFKAAPEKFINDMCCFLVVVGGLILVVSADEGDVFGLYYE